MTAKPQLFAQSGSQDDRGLISYQHRVKNLMAVVRSIAARTIENSTGMADFMVHFDGRLAALCRTQNMLARAGAFELDLEELIREELLAHQAEEQAEIAGPSVMLGQRAAESMSLALHELAINAVKFGALAQDQAQLAVTWRMEVGGLVLEWRENGVATMDVVPKRRGFGREMIENGLAYQLNAQARMDFRPGGVVAVIRIPGEHVRTEAGTP